MKPVRARALVAPVLGLAAAVAAADEQPAVLGWDALAQVKVVRQNDRYVPEFPEAVAALEQKEVKLEGFMIPLKTGVLQTHFLLSALPSECGFCLPTGAEQFAEVQAKAGVKYALEPIVMSGRFELVRDGSGGLLYRLTDAVAVKR
jgi:hypothetical protein